jgi:hypothetical protein
VAPVEVALVAETAPPVGIALVTSAESCWWRGLPHLGSWRHARSVTEGATLPCMRLAPTAPVAGGTLIVGYAVAVSTGSRSLGGVVLLIGGLWCTQTWTRRHGTRTAATLAFVGLGALVLSHLLALAIGAWPSVLLVAAAMAAAAWTRADARAIGSARLEKRGSCLQIRLRRRSVARIGHQWLN